MTYMFNGDLPEWLMGCPAKAMCITRIGSIPIVIDKVLRSCSVVVSTEDFESSNLGSNPSKTLNLFLLIIISNTY